MQSVLVKQGFNVSNVAYKLVTIMLQDMSDTLAEVSRVVIPDSMQMQSDTDQEQDCLDYLRTLDLDKLKEGEKVGCACCRSLTL